MDTTDGQLVWHSQRSVGDYRQKGVYTGHATGDSASDRVFFVTRIQYFDPFEPIPGDAVNEFGDEIATVWINPVLGDTAPSKESAAIKNQLLFDHALMGIGTTGEANTWFDEIRVGLTYADVAPIAASVGVEGDYNGNGIVDAADYTLWRDSLGSATNLDADGDGSGTVDAADYDFWKSRFGNTSGSGLAAGSAVPEPASWLIACVTASALGVWRRQQCNRPGIYAGFQGSNLHREAPLTGL